MAQLKSYLFRSALILILYSGSVFADDIMRCTAATSTEEKDGGIMTAPFIIGWHLGRWDYTEDNRPPNDSEKKGLLTTTFAPFRTEIEIQGMITYTNKGVDKYTTTNAYQRNKNPTTKKHDQFIEVLSSAQGKMLVSNRSLSWSIKMQDDGLWYIKGYLTDYLFKGPYVDEDGNKYLKGSRATVKVDGIYKCMPCDETKGSCSLM
ncbi:MAG: hypothetical protein K0R94_366 [Burkholderiales bacterium]|nr:hypothetical protein [Burkholderiales bacterium]